MSNQYALLGVGSNMKRKVIKKKVEALKRLKTLISEEEKKSLNKKVEDDFKRLLRKKNV